MPARETIGALASRKAELLGRSHELRQCLVAETKKLQPLAEWVDLGITTARQVRHGWELVAPLLAAFRGDSDNPVSGKFQKVRQILRWIRSLAEVWSR